MMLAFCVVATWRYICVLLSICDGIMYYGGPNILLCGSPLGHHFVSFVQLVGHQRQLVHSLHS